MEWKTIRSYGVVFTPEVQSAAFENWAAQLGWLHLANLLALHSRAASLDEKITMRAADRMIQKARKAGLIVHLGGGAWGKTMPREMAGSA